MNDTLTPPAGHKTWLEYAIETLDSQQLYIEHHGDETIHGWPGGIQREDMRASANGNWKSCGS